MASECLFNSSWVPSADPRSVMNSAMRYLRSAGTSGHRWLGLRGNCGTYHTRTLNSDCWLADRALAAHGTVQDPISAVILRLFASQTDGRSESGSLNNGFVKRSKTEITSRTLFPRNLLPDSNTERTVFFSSSLLILYSRLYAGTSVRGTRPRRLRL